jgi:hypothetical protein
MVYVLSEGRPELSGSTPLISNMTSHPAGTGSSFREGKFISVSSGGTTESMFIPLAPNEDVDMSKIRDEMIQEVAPATDTYIYKGTTYSGPEAEENVKDAIKGNIVGSESVQNIIDTQSQTDVSAAPAAGDASSPNVGAIIALAAIAYLALKGGK